MCPDCISLNFNSSTMLFFFVNFDILDVDVSVIIEYFNVLC